MYRKRVRLTIRSQQQTGVVLRFEDSSQETISFKSLEPAFPVTFPPLYSGLVKYAGTPLPRRGAISGRLAKASKALEIFGKACMPAMRRVRPAAKTMFRHITRTGSTSGARSLMMSHMAKKAMSPARVREPKLPPMEQKVPESPEQKAVQKSYFTPARSHCWPFPSGGSLVSEIQTAPSPATPMSYHPAGAFQCWP